MILFVARFRQYFYGLPNANGVALTVVPVTCNFEHEIATFGFRI